MGYKHIEYVGKVKVFDGTAMASQCPTCGEVELNSEQLAGYERRAAALVLRDGNHVDGDVIKYARKALGLRQIELANLLQCSPETLSRWENDATKMQRAEQLALVALLDGVERGIDIKSQLTQGHDNGSSNVKELEVPANRPVRAAV